MLHRLPLLACVRVRMAGSTGIGAQRPSAPACDPDNGGLTLPAGFCAKVVATDLGATRNLVVAPSGDVYVSIRSGARAPGQPPQPGFLMALRDTNGDGTFDQKERFHTAGATGLVSTRARSSTMAAAYGSSRSTSRSPTGSRAAPTRCSPTALPGRRRS